MVELVANEKNLLSNRRKPNNPKVLKISAVVKKSIAEQCLVAKKLGSYKRFRKKQEIYSNTFTSLRKK